MKEKLDKFTKDKLLDFCQLFDIPVHKRVTKKVDCLLTDTVVAVFFCYDCYNINLHLHCPLRRKPQ